MVLDRILSMPQSHARVIIHLVFSVRGRRPCLTKDIQSELFSYLSGVLRGEGHTPIAIGGQTDHVHLLFGLSRTQEISKIVEKLKTSTSIWLKTKNPNLSDFHWQAGYGAFGISPKEIEVVSNYIRNQDDHHKHISFQDEYRRILQEFGIEFDERYVWD